MSWKKSATTALLVAAVAGSWLLAQRRGADIAPSATPLPEPGYYLTGARVLGLDEEGRALYEIRAARIEQEPDTELVSLSDVEIDYALATTAPWRLDADFGTINEDRSQIELNGRVLLRRAAESGDSADLRTSRLLVDVHAQTASSDERVTVSDGVQELQALGMLADLRDERVSLRAEVRGRFLPAAR